MSATDHHVQWVDEATNQVGYTLSNMTKRQAEEFMAMAAEHRPGYKYSIGQPEQEQPATQSRN